MPAPYINGLISGKNVAYNSSGHPVTISGLGGKPFDFLGGHFSVAWHNAEGETLIVRAFRGGADGPGEVQVAEERISLTHLNPVYLQADFHNITRLTLETEHYWQFVVDDLRFALPH